MGGSIPIQQHKGSFAKGGTQCLRGQTSRQIMEVMPIKIAIWALKINGRSVAKNVPLLSEFDNYADWGTDTMRRVWMLYSRPVSLGIDYVVNNLKGRKTSKIEVEAGGLINHKVESKLKKMRKQF